jgi:phosphoribosyl 1,2-cyclic phosphate phosphodiesterase
LRSSGLIRIGEKNILIDVGPDFRAQALAHGIDHLDGVLLTHAHADHIAGIDDLRAYYILKKQKVPCLLSRETFEEVKVRYHYMLMPAVSGKSLSAQLDFQILEEDFGSFVLEGIPFTFFSYFQAGMKVTGFRFGNVAYVSDIREFSHEVEDALRDVDLLILSALRRVPTTMHFGIEEAIAFSRRVSAKRTLLTHLSHDLEYAATNAILPSDIRMGYDGLKVAIEIPD